VGLGHPSKFQRVSRLDFFNALRSLNGDQPNFARSLAVSCAGTLHIHFWGFLPPNGILPGAKFTLRPSLAFSYIGNVTARHSSSGCQSNFVAWDKEGNYGTFSPRLRHLFAGRPTRWASAHILVCIKLTSNVRICPRNGRTAPEVNFCGAACDQRPNTYFINVEY